MRAVGAEEERAEEAAATRREARRVGRRYGRSCLRVEEGECARGRTWCGACGLRSRLQTPLHTRAPHCWLRGVSMLRDRPPPAYRTPAPRTHGPDRKSPARDEVAKSQRLYCEPGQSLARAGVPRCRCRSAMAVQVDRLTRASAAKSEPRGPRSCVVGRAPVQVSHAVGGGRPDAAKDVEPAAAAAAAAAAASRVFDHGGEAQAIAGGGNGACD